VSSDSPGSPGDGFHVVIPVRYAARRLPGKPLAPIAGRPMIEWVHARALASGAREVLVATDDERIAAACRGFGARVRMTDAAHPSGTDRVAEVAAREEWGEQAVVVNLQGDEPLMPSRLLAQAARALLERPGHAVATLCTPIERAGELFDPAVVKVVRDVNGDALYFSRAPIPWHREAFAGGLEALPEGCRWWRHLGLYAYRVGFLRRLGGLARCPLEDIEALEQLRFLHAGERIHVAEAGERPPPGVDTAEDLERVRRVLAEGEEEG